MLKKIAVTVAKVGLSCIYFFLKLLPTQRKITLISRQTNKPSLDFQLLEKEIKARKYKCVILTKTLGKTPSEMFLYVFHILKQTYHIATSQTVIIDTYCIPVSILKHKKNLKVVQIWHALGGLKKFGYSVIDSKEGSEEFLAEAFEMHKNYTYVLTSSKATIPSFAEAFHVDPQIVLPIPLPRVDLLTDEKYKAKITQQIQKKYPQMKSKKTILYAPTFRKGQNIDYEKFIKAFDPQKYNIVVILHYLSNSADLNNRYPQLIPFKGELIDAMIASDFVVTDYSAIVFEAAILKKPLFFYAYDLDEYIDNRGFYIDYEKEMPGIISRDIKDVVNAIESEDYDINKINNFARKYVSITKEKCTKQIVDLAL